MPKKKSSGSRKYGKSAGKSVKSAMHRKKKGTLKSGKGGKGGKGPVESRPSQSVFPKPARKGQKSRRNLVSAHSCEINLDRYIQDQPFSRRCRCSRSAIQPCIGVQ